MATVGHHISHAGEHLHDGEKQRPHCELIKEVEIKSILNALRNYISGEIHDSHGFLVLAVHDVCSLGHV